VVIVLVGYVYDFETVCTCMLYKAVQSEGGFETVTRTSGWRRVVSKLGYKDEKNAGPMLWQNYEKILYPYDLFISGATTASQV